MNQNDIKKILLKACNAAGGQSAWAKSKGISAAYVNDALAGRREVGDKILEALGYEKVVTYKLKRAEGRKLQLPVKG